MAGPVAQILTNWIVMRLFENLNMAKNAVLDPKRFDGNNDCSAQLQQNFK